MGLYEDELGSECGEVYVEKIEFTDEHRRLTNYGLQATGLSIEERNELNERISNCYIVKRPWD